MSRPLRCNLFLLTLLTGLVACGDDDASDAATAAPPCPPGITQVTDLAQVVDADRDNGQVYPDYGNVPSPAPLVGDPAAPGPHAVARESVSVPRPLGDSGISRGTLYMPADAGTYPLVVVLPGYGATHTGYAAYSELFASHGFFVLGLDTGEGGSDHALEAARTVAAIEWVSSAGPRAVEVDASRIAVAGHSKGGKLAFWAAALDERIDLVIAWDPSNSGGAPCFIDPSGCNAQPAAPNCNTPNGGGAGVLHQMHAESLIVGVPPDSFTNPDPAHNALHFYRGAPGPTTYVALRGRHADFLVGNPALQTFTRRVSTIALLTRLQGRIIAPDYLVGGAGFDPDGVLSAAPRSK